MKLNKYLVFMTVALAVMLVGCRTAPVMNVDSTPVTANVKSEKDVKKAIIAAGNSRGWRMKDMGNGVIEGTLLLRGNMAKVSIKYSKKSYSITYKDSQGLNYDGTNIHSNYNGWVQNLDNSIQSQLSLL